MKINRLSDLADAALCRRLVVKVGSSLLVGKDGVRRVWLEGLVAELADARARGQEVIVVSSGAIALGAAKLGLDKGGRGSLADAQAAAAVGQIALSGLWAELLGAHGVTAAQLLLTLEDLEDRRRYLNATATLTRLLDAGAVPVINENDSVATQEIRFGDNDRLAARVAQAAQANAVLLLSDVDGLFDRNPAEPGAKLLPEVRGVTAEVHAMATGGSSSGMARGLDHIERAGDIAALKPFRVGRVDHPRDMDHRFGALTKELQRGMVIEIAAHPLDPVARRLVAAGQRADGNPGLGRAVKQSLADKPGRPGHRYGHSTTIWSRWTTAERGA